MLSTIPFMKCVKTKPVRVLYPAGKAYPRDVGLFFEISVVQTFKPFSMTGFVFTHFMNGIGVAKGVDAEVLEGLKAHFTGE